MLKKILLIDDSIASNVIHEELLKDMGIADEIILRDGVNSAISYLKGNETNGIPPAPELIFLDIEMPEKDGFDFLEEFLKLGTEVTNDFKIVIAMLSNHLDTENFDRAKDYKMIGVLDHIRKPIYREDVENILEEYFNGQ